MCAGSLDSVAEWFLRLNGFFTILNFVVHPVHAKEGTRQRTDADVLGVRFPHRQEVVGGEPLTDDAAFHNLQRPMLAIAEVKTRVCKLNGPWTRQRDENVENVLRALGYVAPTLVAAVSASLYQSGRFESSEFEARLLCFGASTSDRLPTGALQFTWAEVLRFIHGRYQTFWNVKRQHQQWPPVGQFLWDRCRDRNRDEYVTEMLRIFNIER
jgi:hypothetical protein